MNTNHSHSRIAFDPQAGAYTLTLRLASRAQAELAYLRALDSPLAGQVERIAANIPELASRVRQAGLLVVAGAVIIAPPGETLRLNGRETIVLACVRSDCGSFDHLLTRGELGVVVCGCPDAQPGDGEAGAPWSRLAPHTCRHVLAAGLLQGH